MQLDSGYNLIKPLVNLTHFSDEEFVCKKVNMYIKITHNYLIRRPLGYIKFLCNFVVKKVKGLMKI